MRFRSPAGTALLAAVLAATPPLAAQGLQAANREVRAALKAIDEDPTTGDRAVAAIARLGTFDDVKAARALLDAAEELEKLVAPIAAQRRKALLAGGGSGRLKRSRYALRNLEDAAEAIGKALAAQRSPAAVRGMLERLTEPSSTLPLWLRLQIAARAGEQPDAKLDWRPRKEKKIPNDTVLAMLAAFAALGRRAGEGPSGAWVTAQLVHDNTDVRRAAARAIARLANPAGIEPLVDRIDREQGEVREAVLDALVVLTGQYPGDSTGSWRAWLAAEGAPYLVGEVALGTGDASKRDRTAAKGTVSGSYFGIEQTGESILYVFDNSNSMQAKLGAKAKGNAATTGGAPQTRWQLCKIELKKALRALPPQRRFNLLGFANRIRCFEASMQPATAENVARAITWLDGLQLEFETNVFDALELAFVLAGRGTTDRYYRPDVDTIFFLSDGAPTIPNLGEAGIGRDDADRILAAVRRWNTLGRITVHSIGLGLQPRKRERNDQGQLWPPVFLRLLAEQNGGRYEGRRQ